MPKYVATIPTPSADRLKPDRLVVEHVDIDFGGGRVYTLFETGLDADAEPGGAVFFSLDKLLQLSPPVAILDAGSYDRVFVSFANSTGTRGENRWAEVAEIHEPAVARLPAQYAADWLNHWLEHQPALAAAISTVIANVPADVEKLETDEFPIHVDDQGRMTAFSFLNTVLRPSGQVLVGHYDDETGLPIMFEADAADNHPLHKIGD